MEHKNFGAEYGFATRAISIRTAERSRGRSPIAVYRLLNELLNHKFGVETTLVDTSDPANMEAAIRPDTKLIHIETPGNPTLTISDIAAIAEIAHHHGVLLSVDNTFASPFNQRPIEFGADFSVVH